MLHLIPFEHDDGSAALDGNPQVCGTQRTMVTTQRVMVSSSMLMLQQSVLSMIMYRCDEEFVSFEPAL